MIAQGVVRRKNSRDINLAIPFGGQCGTREKRAGRKLKNAVEVQ